MGTRRVYVDQGRGRRERCKLGFSSQGALTEGARLIARRREATLLAGGSARVPVIVDRLVAAS
jgi:hypothetical protein